MSPVEDVAQEIAELAARLDAATHRLLECIRIFDESGEWYEQGATSCAHWLAWRIGLDPGAAREKVRVARALGKLPVLDEALRVGKLSYAKVRALTRVATPETEKKLLEVAVVATGAQLERICRGYRNALAPEQTPSPEERSVRRRELPGGMVRLEIVLSPDEADLVMRAMNRAREVRHAEEKVQLPVHVSAETANGQSEQRDETDQVGELAAAEGLGGGGRQAHGSAPATEAADGELAPTDEAEGPGPQGVGRGASGIPWVLARYLASDRADDDDSPRAPAEWPSRADGMVTLAESFLAGHVARGSGGDRFQVMVHVDQDPLAADGVLAATLEDGTRISAETLRRVACDSGIVAVSGREPEGLNIGRRSRSIPSAIRRALLLRDHGCRFPGCTHDRFLHTHHVKHWLHGGETSVSNCITVCSHHHHLVHEGGWTVEWAADGELVFKAPNGRTLAPEPPRELSEDLLLWLRDWADDHGVDIGPDTNMPTWDGMRVDYQWAVSALIRA